MAKVLEAGEDDVVLVVSQPDRPKGRGQKIEPTPVKAEAEAHGIPVIQPTKLKDGVVAEQLRGLDLDLAIVVAYGRILPKAVFEAPMANSWNVHASLLPRHRGASPIQHAILAGDPETGVDLMMVGEGLDEGDVLLERRLPLHGNETTGTLTPALAELGAQALVDGLRLAKTEGLLRKPRHPTQVPYSPRLEKHYGPPHARPHSWTFVRRFACTARPAIVRMRVRTRAMIAGAMNSPSSPASPKAATAAATAAHAATAGG